MQEVESFVHEDVQAPLQLANALHALAPPHMLGDGKGPKARKQVLNPSTEKAVDTIIVLLRTQSCLHSVS